MNTDDARNQTCGRCGAPLSPHDLDGLCTRCVVRCSILTDGAEPRNGTPDENLPASPHPGSSLRFGDYELLDEIARGGMGVVYRARQVSLDRIVAVKMLLLGQFAAPGVFQRFRAEAEAAAKLQHPNIVAIHAIGEQEGQPFFSMDYVAGRNLGDLVRDQPLSGRAAAQYLVKIARAVQHAHDHGILHRDLKPANILIDEADEPRITDFGLAKRLTPDSPLATDHASLTLTGQVLGSPNFLPPEQAGGQARVIGPACDIYGLGAVLYYLLTARPPFVAETFESTLFHVLNTDPVPPRQLNPSVPLDLETICLKCLEKEPVRRYGSAKELADEMDRFLRDEPIRARPIGVIGRTWRWCRRKPALAAMTVGLVTAVALGLLGILWQWWRAEEVAVRERALANVRFQERYAADMALTQSRLQQDNIELARALLQQYVPKPNQTDIRGFEWYLFDRLSRGDQVRTLSDCGDIRTIAAWKDGSLLAIGGLGQPGVLILYPTTGRIHSRLPTREAQVCSLALSPDEKLLAVGSDPAAYPSGTDRGIVELWDLTRQQVIATLKARAPRVTFSPVEPLLAVGSGGEMVGRTEGQVILWRYADPRETPVVLPQSGGRAVFSPDGQLLVSGLWEMQLTVWDVKTRQSTGRMRTDSGLLSMQYSPEGILLATGHNDGSIQLFDVRKHTWAGTLQGHSKRVMGLGFLAGGKRLASASYDQTVRLWDLEDRQLAAKYRGTCTFEDLVVIPPDETLATGFSEGRLDFWHGPPSRESEVLRNTPGLLFSPDGAWILAQSGDGTIRFLESSTGRIHGVISNLVSPATLAANPGRACEPWLLGFAPHGEAFWTGDHVLDNCELARLRIWRFPSGLLQNESPLDSMKGFDLAPALSPDAQTLAAGNPEGEVAVWSAQSGRLLKTLRGHAKRVLALVFDPTSQLLASNADDGSAILWQVRDWQPKHRFAPSTGLTGAAFSSDGKLYAATCWDRKTYIWQSESGELVATLQGHQMSVRCVAFSPDNKTLATGADDHTVRLWSLASGREVGVFPHEAWVYSVQFAPQGNRLAASVAALAAAYTQLWDASPVDHKATETQIEKPARASLRE